MRLVLHFHFNDADSSTFMNKTGQFLTRAFPNITLSALKGAHVGYDNQKRQVIKVLQFGCLEVKDGSATATDSQSPCGFIEVRVREFRSSGTSRDPVAGTTDIDAEKEVHEKKMKGKEVSHTVK